MAFPLLRLVCRTLGTGRYCGKAALSSAATRGAAVAGRLATFTLAHRRNDHHHEVRAVHGLAHVARDERDAGVASNRPGEADPARPPQGFHLLGLHVPQADGEPQQGEVAGHALAPVARSDDGEPGRGHLSPSPISMRGKNEPLRLAPGWLARRGGQNVRLKGERLFIWSDRDGPSISSKPAPGSFGVRPRRVDPPGSISYSARGLRQADERIVRRGVKWPSR